MIDAAVFVDMHRTGPGWQVQVALKKKKYLSDICSGKDKETQKYTTKIIQEVNKAPGEIGSQ